jgi:hypothetical protein
MSDSFKAYGFDYPFNGMRYTLRILASSEAAAREQAEAMRNFTFSGELEPPPL